jgi:hypothetical protein
MDPNPNPPTTWRKGLLRRLDGRRSEPVCFVAFDLLCLGDRELRGEVGGVAMGVGGVLWQTTSQSRVDSSVLSRVSSYDWLGSMALLLGGYALSGLLAASLDASKLLAGGAVLQVATTAVGLVALTTPAMSRRAPLLFRNRPHA